MSGASTQRATDLPDELLLRKFVQPLRQKHFCFRQTQIRITTSLSRSRKRDAMDAAAPGAGITCEKMMMLLRTAKSWSWRQKWHTRHFSYCCVQKWPVFTQFIRKTAFIAAGQNDF